MSKQIKPFQLPGGATIYVEAEDVDTPTQPGQKRKVPGLPEGAEPTSTLNDLVDGGKALQETISQTAQTVLDSLENLQPDEFQLELNIGLKGKANIIPVLVSSEGNASIKITAKWVKPPQDKN